MINIFHGQIRPEDKEKLNKVKELIDSILINDKYSNIRLPSSISVRLGSNLKPINEVSLGFKKNDTTYRIRIDIINK